MKKILVLAPFHSTHIQNRYSYLKNMNYQSDIIWPVKKGNTIVKKWWNKLNYLKTIYVTQADIYHAHYASSGAAILAVLLGKFPLMLSTMGGDILFDEQADHSKIQRIIIKFILKIVDIVTVKSNYNKNIINSYGINKDKVTVLTWGIESTVFIPLSESDFKRVDHFPFLPKDKKIILQPRGVKAVYNTSLLLKAIKVLIEKGSKDLVLWLPKLNICNPNDVDEVLLLVKKLGLESVVISSGYLTKEEMNLAYNRADLLVSIAQSDGIPMSVMEALATNTPVVLGKLPHLIDEFPDDIVSWTDLNEGSISKAISNILESKKQITSHNKLRTYVCNRFNLQQNILTYEKEINRLSKLKIKKYYWQRALLLVLLIVSVILEMLTNIIGRKKMDWAYCRSHKEI